jgi:hypothetical protein
MMTGGEFVSLVVLYTLFATFLCKFPKNLLTIVPEARMIDAAIYRAPKNTQRFNNLIRAALIQRGGGTGPTKPRQPLCVWRSNAHRMQEGANSGSVFWKMGGVEIHAAATGMFRHQV